MTDQQTKAPISMEPAALAYTAAKRAAVAQKGKVPPPEYERLLRAWRDALLELEAAAERATKAREIADAAAA